MNRFLTIIALVVLCSPGFGQDLDDLQEKSKIAGTPHDLSAESGRLSPQVVLTDFSMCRSCHVPHRATAVEPLWYRKGGQARFEMDTKISNGTEHVHPLDPGSRNCLSCHDGGMAPSFPHRGENNSVQVNLTAPEVAAPANYNMHLFNFPPSGAEISQPGDDSPLMVTDQGEVGCITCHDPHNNENGRFLRVSNERSAICLECHHMSNWEQSTHGNPQNPLHAGLEELACLQCHQIHTLPTNAKLLRADENTLCLSCHDGSRDEDVEVPSVHDLEQVFEKPFTHPIRINPNVRDIGYDNQSESPWNFGLADDRFVRCGDCHNPHAVAPENVSPLLDGSLAFVEGVDAMGFSKSRADAEFEVCYKCHGQNQNTTIGNDVARLFAAGNRSFHPIETVGMNMNVPSLIDEWSEQSIMTCSDCHGNDDSYGPQGPHGSNYPHILKASYSDSPYGALDEQALCFKCHDQRKIVSNMGFKFHSLHIERAGYSCAACHDPHGSMDMQALLNLGQLHITEFDGQKVIESMEPGHGTCTLKCHGTIHRGEVY
jgi:predicted CXXCH cytochrome family protein